MYYYYFKKMQFLLHYQVLCVRCIVFIHRLFYREWIFGDVYCTVNNFIAYMSVAVSVFSLVAIAVDRQVSIIHTRLTQHGPKNACARGITP